jgi:cysteinyl-tRNA synthetase
MPEEAPKKETAEKHLEKMTVKELREIAAELPHERAISDMKKEEMIAFIKKARGIKGEAQVKKKKPRVKIKLTKPELKAKIRTLRALREEALDAKDCKKADLLRHQISQWRKKSRRVATA